MLSVAGAAGVVSASACSSREGVTLGAGEAARGGTLPISVSGVAADTGSPVRENGAVSTRNSAGEGSGWRRGTRWQAGVPGAGVRSLLCDEGGGTAGANLRAGTAEGAGEGVLPPAASAQAHQPSATIGRRSAAFTTFAEIRCVERRFRY